MKNFFIVVCLLASSPCISASGRFWHDALTLEGQWIIESFEYDGSQLLDRERIAMDPEELFVVKGDRLTILSKKKEFATWTIKADQSKSPKQVDIYLSDKTVLLGIYSVSEDRLLVSISKDPTSNRPKTFNSTDQKGDVAVFIFKRKQQKNKKSE